ncbi:sialin-like [Neocloeon triangulifer]|uniref:sialin-like n=1 Tax=Neocloeon triangulifer TaxID=2078957 RepID=UPI00286EF70C|nr:sialin-like [Neocloeon triangulifer]
MSSPPETRDAASAASGSWLHPRNIPARVVLGFLSFSGFLTNYMLRVNLNIAIVSMTGAANSTDANRTLAECKVNITGFELDESPAKSVAEFDWDNYEQGLIHGSFYWGYVLSMVPGGMLADNYGAKLIYGGSNLICSLMGFLIPAAARMHLNALLGVRFFQGFAAGVTWPAMNVMASRWIPPDERSKFISTYMGNSVGVALTFPLCGILIEAFGWEWAFHVPALICLLWCVWWWYCAFDSPSQHPRISKEELDYLEKNVIISKKKLALPVMEILKSAPFWALLVANLGSMWAFMTVTTYGPTYLKMVYDINVKKNGFLSGLPNISRFTGSLFFSWLFDKMISLKHCSITSARKVANAISQLIPSILFMLMGAVGCNYTAEVIVLTAASLLGGCASSGPIVNSVDLAPNFSGSIMGLMSLAGMSSGFLVPMFVGFIIKEDQSMERWSIVFQITAALGFVATVIFSVFGSGKVQSWNEPREKIARGCNGFENEQELKEPLRSQNGRERN